MKATQFIKDHGLERARGVVEGAPDKTATHYVADTDTYYSEDFLTYFDHSLDDWETADLNSIDELETIYELVIDLRILKRLVEPVDLVNSLGGKSGAIKEYFEYVHSGKSELNVRPNELARAIKDYESIYGKEGASHGALE